MNGRDPDLDDLLAPMRDGPIALSSAAEASARRERLLPGVRTAVQHAPGRVRRARRMRRTFAVCGGCAAALATAFAVVQLRGAGDRVAEAEWLRVEPLGGEAVTWIDAAGARSALPRATEISSPGELVTAADSGSRVSTARGVRVELAPRTRLRVTAVDLQSRRSGLRLEQGEVHCSVPPLGAREQFSISTPDAQVIVHGTEFSVRFGDLADARTCVRVSEGLVEVRHRAGSVRLGPGASWGCERSAPQPAATAAQDRDRADAPALAPAPEAQARRRPAKARSGSARSTARRSGAHTRALEGTLDAENELLAAALAAERADQRARARALFTALLEEHPHSPLAPEARAGLSRTR